MTCVYHIDLSGQSNDTIPAHGDIMPAFPGGPDVMYRFIFENIRYPVKARKAGISGKVITQFNIEPDGSLTDIHIVKGVSEDLDNEALRVIALMNERFRWQPGIHDGKPVSVVFTLPLRFELN